MHNDQYKINAAFLCNINFTNSLEELKPFLGFQLNKIDIKKQISEINSENHLLIVDSSYNSKILFNKIKIPIILILKQNEKNDLDGKFNITIKLPLNIVQFNRAVIDLSQRHKFDKNSIIKVKNYVLDKNTRFLRQKDNSIKITEKEMNFIEELNNSSTPLTKDYILKNIWKYSSDTDTHTIETHIYRLRQKIKNKFNDKNFIKFIKGGYSI